MTSFVGAKAALFCNGRVLTYLRDDRPDLPFAGLWDLPGGGREGEETPAACLLREVEEEFALRLPESRLIWRGEFPSMLDPDRRSWFFAGDLLPEEPAAIRFGDEGQCWQMMPLQDWLSHGQAVPEMQRRTRLALSSPSPVQKYPGGPGARPPAPGA